MRRDFGSVNGGLGPGGSLKSYKMMINGFDPAAGGIMILSWDYMGYWSPVDVEPTTGICRSIKCHPLLPYDCFANFRS